MEGMQQAAPMWCDLAVAASRPSAMRLSSILTGQHAATVVQRVSASSTPLTQEVEPAADGSCSVAAWSQPRTTVRCIWLPGMQSGGVGAAAAGCAGHDKHSPDAFWGRLRQAAVEAGFPARLAGRRDGQPRHLLPAEPAAGTCSSAQFDG
jgi:hypothetical protein